MPPHLTDGGQGAEKPDGHGAKGNGERPGGEQGGQAWRRATESPRGTMRHSPAARLLRGPDARLSPALVPRSPSKNWQRLKWEKVEAAEVAVVETSIFTLAGWRQVSGGFE